MVNSAQAAIKYIANSNTEIRWFENATRWRPDAYDKHRAQPVFNLNGTVLLAACSVQSRKLPCECPFFMRYLITFLFLLLAFGTARAQEFDRLDRSSIQPALSQPLQWVSASATVSPGLPDAFSANPQAWAFAPYAPATVLPTATGQDVWLRFTLAASPTPQSWIIRIPRLTVKKVSLYAFNANGFLPVQTAGASIAHTAWSRNTRTPSFEVVTSNVEKTYFLRFEHHAPVTERPELMSQSDFADGIGRVGILLGLMLGVFGLLVIACLAGYAMARNTVFISLAIFVAATLLHYLVLMGFGALRLWPNSAQLAQVMQWTAPLLAMAAGCWFFAQASYAKDSNAFVYRVLCGLALVSFALAVLQLTGMELMPRNFLNGWAAFVLVVVVACLLWLGLRDKRWNFWLMAGLLPIAGAGASRLAYNLGWLAHVEFEQVASVLLTHAGLTSLFVVLVWRGRTALLSSQLTTALNISDAATGLVTERVALTRLPQMLNRATQLKLGCGAIMLHWHNFAQLTKTENLDKQGAMLKHFGQVLNRVARDIDTAARIDDDRFLILVEGPVNKQTLSLLSTQILTACLRASDKFDLPNAFGLHLAIWQATVVPLVADEVMQLLKARLDQMALGTRRPVQFVDAMASEMAPDSDNNAAQRRSNLMAKIDAVEALTSVQAVLTPETPRK